MARVLVVDDDRRLAELVALALERAGYETDVAVDGREALAKVAVTPPDVILLDFEMPDMSAVEVLDALRRDGRRPTIPVVIFTGGRTTPADEVLGLRRGAIDYIRKGADLDVIRARLDGAILRQSDTSAEGSTITINGLRIDTAGGRVFVEDREVDLENRQFAVLAYLASRRGTVVSRTELLEEVWGTTYTGFQHAVDQTIYEIRKRLGDGTWIRTIPRRGYRFGG